MKGIYLPLLLTLGCGEEECYKEAHSFVGKNKINYCLAYDPTREECVPLVDPNLHVSRYNSLEMKCSEAGRTEDEQYALEGLTARDAKRGQFLLTNPLQVLGTSLSFSDGEARISYVGNLWSGGAISYAEISGGSEHNNIDHSATLIYHVFDRSTTPQQELGTLLVRASRLTARGQCMQDAILLDTARKSAIGSQYDKSEPFYPFDFNKTSNVRWVRTGRGYAFSSEDRLFWTSKEYAIELFNYRDSREPREHDFAFDQFIEQLAEVAPSEIDCNHRLCEDAEEVFIDHKSELLGKKCIPQ